MDMFAIACAVMSGGRFPCDRDNLRLVSSSLSLEDTASTCALRPCAAVVLAGKECPCRWRRACSCKQASKRYILECDAICPLACLFTNASNTYNSTQTLTRTGTHS